MSRFVLDTDTVVHLLRGHEKVCRRTINVLPEDSLAITIVTVEELLSGWYTQIRRARNDDQILRAYAALQQTIEFVGGIFIWPFDELALSKFRELRGQKLRVGSNDLKIAAIILQIPDAVLVTSNYGDFEKVSGLTIEDWTRS